MQQKISIITICLNAAAHIDKAFKSVHSQSYPEIEHVIIDGGSTDETLNIIKKYRDKVDYLVSEPDSGLYNAMNKGIKVATGEVLFFLNADDYFADADVVSDAMAIFNKRSEISVVYGNQIFDLGEKKVTKKQPSQVTRTYLAETTIQHQTVFARKKVFELTGGFSEHFKIVSDFEWMFKVFVENRCPHLYLDRDITVMATQGVSWTNDFETERMEVMKRYLSNYEIYKYRVIPMKLNKLMPSLMPRLRRWMSHSAS